MSISSCHWLLYSQKEEGRSAALGSGVSLRTTRLDASCTVWLVKVIIEDLRSHGAIKRPQTNLATRVGQLWVYPWSLSLLLFIFTFSTVSSVLMRTQPYAKPQSSVFASYMKRSKLTRKWLFSSLYYFILYIPLAFFFKKIFFSLPELFDWQFAFFFHTTQGVCVSLCVCVIHLSHSIKTVFYSIYFFELWYKLFSFMLKFYAYLIFYNITK